MHGFVSNVLSCQERERLEEQLFKARTRGRYLSRLRHLTYREQALSRGLRIMKGRTVAGGKQG